GADEYGGDGDAGVATLGGCPDSSVPIPGRDRDQDTRPVRVAGRAAPLGHGRDRRCGQSPGRGAARSGDGSGGAGVASASPSL
ncbi:MAG: hypothetical protein AVDCRST_MAG70-870, partial [uncultured Thermomicrobiales bacterium]